MSGNRDRVGGAASPSVVRPARSRPNESARSQNQGGHPVSEPGAARVPCHGSHDTTLVEAEPSDVERVVTLRGDPQPDAENSPDRRDRRLELIPAPSGSVERARLGVGTAVRDRLVPPTLCPLSAGTRKGHEKGTDSFGQKGTDSFGQVRRASQHSCVDPTSSGQTSVFDPTPRPRPSALPEAASRLCPLSARLGGGRFCSLDNLGSLSYAAWESRPTRT